MGPTTVVIAKRGDILLEMGENDSSVKLLVSSSVLSLASPVFEVMFRGQFSEGQNLSSKSPKLVPLPDDDPDHMTLLCKVIHLQNSSIPVRLGLEALSDFTDLCDKYDTADAVRSWSLLWVSKLLLEITKPGFERLMYITYTLDLAEEFYSTTQELLKKPAIEWNYETASNGHEDLRTLAHDLAHERESVQEQLMSTIQSIYQPKCNIRSQCKVAEMAHKNFLAMLSDAQLWPFKRDRTLLEYKEGVSSLVKLIGVCGCSFNSSCPFRNGAVGKMMQKVYQIVDSMKGRCLDCVKRGSDASDGRSCRIPHTSRDGC